MSDALESAKAIDEGLAEDLRAVGVTDLRDLRAVGAGEAWERLLAADLRDSLSSRVALEAAVAGRRVSMLDPEARERCVEHVRRRLARDPAAAVAGARRFKVPPPSASRDTPRARAAARRARIVTIAVVCVIVFLLATLLFASV